MKTTIKISLAVLLGCGALLLVLGIVIWTGNGDALIPVHITLGVVLVLTLWTIAFMAARAGVPMGTVASAGAWGLLVVLLGLAQEDVLTGSWHWTIQVVHLAVSMGAIWWGRHLVKLIGQARSKREPTAAHAPLASAHR